MTADPLAVVLLWLGLAFLATAWAWLVIRKMAEIAKAASKAAALSHAATLAAAAALAPPEPRTHGDEGGHPVPPQ